MVAARDVRFINPLPSAFSQKRLCQILWLSLFIFHRGL